MRLLDAGTEQTCTKSLLAEVHTAPHRWPKPFRGTFFPGVGSQLLCHGLEPPPRAAPNPPSQADWGRLREQWFSRCLSVLQTTGPAGPRGFLCISSNRLDKLCYSLSKWTDHSLPGLSPPLVSNTTEKTVMTFNSTV